MKKSTFRVLLSMLVLCALLFTFFAVQALANGSNNVTFEGVTIESEYEIGQEITLPTVKAVKGGQEYATESAIILPDGTMKAVSREILSVAGKYSLVYSAYIDGFKYEQKYDFSVKQGLFNMDRPTATATYDAENDQIGIHFDGNNSFRYNSVIDLSDNTLETPFLEVYNVASVDAQRDCDTLMIRLTDADDENNFIDIRINASPDFTKYPYTYYTSYVAVSINDDMYVGMQDGGKIHKGNIYGRAVRFSFSNNGWAGDKWTEMPSQDKFIEPKNDRLMLYYVAEERAIYAYSTTLKGYGGLVVDFDDDKFYKEFWDGFTADKVKLSMYTTAMKVSNADFFITTIDGQDLSRAVVVDNVGPDINIDLPEQLPFGITGYEYEVFDYSVRDDYGVVSSSVNAYYDYYSNFPISLSVENGKILPKYQGLYTLVYSAVDSYGNVTKEYVDIQVDDRKTASPIRVFAVDNYADCLAGMRVDLKDCQPEFDEKYGEVTVKVSAVCGNYTAEIKNEEYFYANAVGEWKVIYELKDRLGRKAINVKTFNAQPNPTPVFGEQGYLLPEYLLSGKTYTLPDVKAVKYNADSTEVLTPTVSYTINGSASAPVENGVITPAYVSGQENILEITYTVNSVEYTLARPVIQTLKDTVFDARGLFFVEEGAVETELQETGMVISATENSVVDFVTPVIVNTFALEFTMLSNGKLSVILADEKNQEQTLVVDVMFKNGMTTVSLNGINLDSYQKADTTLTLRDNTLKVQATSFNVRRFSDGSDYNGFDSKVTMVGFVLEEGTQVKISKVGNQPISNFNEDAIKPSFYLDGNFEIYYKKGDEITVPKAYAIDAISGVCDVTVTVKVNGKYVTDVQGRTLNQLALDQATSFIADKYGIYSIVYQAVDSVDNEYKLTNIINVPDDIAPEITVVGEIASEVTLGTKITVPQASVEDNLSDHLDVTVFTINPILGYETVLNGEITFNRVGVWTVRYFAIDEEGNITCKDFKVNVKEA